MFLEIATNENEARELFSRHPLWITALIEHYWRRRSDNTQGVRNWAWPPIMTNRIGDEFGWPLPQLDFTGDSDHLIYAYLVENTRIYDIFAKVLKTYRSGEELGKPAESRQFWDTTERLFFSDPPPTTVWSVTSRIRPDERAQRMSTYWWMLGLSLDHAAEIAQAHPYQKPAGANVDFIPAFEALAREVRRGIVNRANQYGANDTDDEAIAREARRIGEMFATRRLDDNLLREEYRGIAMLSWLHLAVAFNESPVVRDLGARGSSPDQRLCNIAERVRMKAHPKSQALLGLAQPFSVLLRWIEGDLFDTPREARRLYTDDDLRGVAEVVIGQYSQAMERDLKAVPVAVSPPAAAPDRQLASPRPLQVVGGGQQAGNSAPAAAQSP
jgi:hypothetical protein